MPAKTDPREVPSASRYYYRRALSARDMLSAIGAGVAVGLAAFYVTRVMLERTPLVGDSRQGRPVRRRHRRSSTRARGG